jgi:putative ABC transport system substrate-binding protein
MSAAVSRRTLVRGMLGTAAVMAFGVACNPAAQRKYRIGFLSARSSECVLPREWEVVHGVAIKTAQTPPQGNCPDSPLVRALEARGYRYGVNLDWLGAGPTKYVEQGAGGTEGDFTQAAAYLAARHVDVIVAHGENAAIAAKQATTTIPIVLNNVDDAVEIGLVPSLARPGGNITGVSVRTVDLAMKRIEILKDAFPSVKHPMLVYGTAPSHVAAIGPAVEAARQLGLSAVAVQFAPGSCRPSVESNLESDVHMLLLPATVRATAVGGAVSRGESDAVLFCSGHEWSDFYSKASRALEDGADSLVVIAALNAPAPLANLARGWRLPGVFPTTNYLGIESLDPASSRSRPGSVVGVGAICFRESTDLAAVVAAYVDRILRGAQPGDLSITSPNTFELVVNLTTAEELGLTISPSVLARATTVVR